VDAIREVPPDRWDIATYYDPRAGALGKTNARWGGFIDGIDQFHFSKDRRKDGRPAFSHWILTDDGKGKPREVLTVPGWFHSKEGKDTFLSFLVVGYGQGAASKEGITARGQVGVIRVGIFECYPLKDGDSPKGGDETGFGPGVPGIVKPVRYGVGKELDSIAVRYTREQ